MPRPIAHANGVFHLNIRVPSDIAARVRGTAVTLPLGDAQVTIRPSDKVILSLRTRDPRLAKARFSAAEQALQLHWEGIRRGPVRLTHKQIVALAGSFYRARVEHFESDSEYIPDGFLRETAQFEVDLSCWKNDPTGDLGDIGERDARVLATLALGGGPFLLAYERGTDVDEFGAVVRYDDAIDYLFGRHADEICRRQHLVIDDVTRRALLREIAQANKFLDHKLARNSAGDYTPDPNAARFPNFVPPPQTPAEAGPLRGDVVSVAALFEKRREKRGPALAASTIRRYGPAVASLDAHTKGKDVRLLTEDDVWAWAEARVAAGASARTVNRNDVVAIASLLGWAMTRDGGRLRTDNPTMGVRLEEPKVRVLREPTFRSAEVTTILTLARSVEPDPRYPKAAAGRRWVPWICAYSGARVQEVLHLERDGVWDEGGEVGWVMRFPLTKDGVSRTVPIHEHLVAEGLIDYWRASGAGHLFMFDKPPIVLKNSPVDGYRSRS